MLNNTNKKIERITVIYLQYLLLSSDQDVIVKNDCNKYQSKINRYFLIKIYLMLSKIMMLLIYKIQLNKKWL